MDRWMDRSMDIDIDIYLVDDLEAAEHLPHFHLRVPPVQIHPLGVFFAREDRLRTHKVPVGVGGCVCMYVCRIDGCMYIHIYKYTYIYTYTYHVYICTGSTTYRPSPVSPKRSQQVCIYTTPPPPPPPHARTHTHTHTRSLSLSNTHTHSLTHSHTAYRPSSVSPGLSQQASSIRGAMRSIAMLSST